MGSQGIADELATEHAVLVLLLTGHQVALLSWHNFALRGPPFEEPGLQRLLYCFPPGAGMFSSVGRSLQIPEEETSMTCSVMRWCVCSGPSTQGFYV